MRATAAAVALGILLVASSDTAATARGSSNGATPPHFAPSHRSPPVYRALRRQPLYGGVIGAPFFGPDDYFDYPPYAPYAPDTSSGSPGVAPAVRGCPQPTHKTVTVPAEAGGSQQVTVTYCHP
jgi:hypothetical protein